MVLTRVVSSRIGRDCDIRLLRRHYPPERDSVNSPLNILAGSECNGDVSPIKSNFMFATVADTLEVCCAVPCYGRQTRE